MAAQLSRHLVSTKFSPPHIRTRHVLRMELLAHLQQMQQCRLALISGAAGYGKTTLLAQWRQSCLKSGAEVAWLSLGAEDADYPPFCSALLTALRQSGVPTELDMLVDDPSPSAVDSIVAGIVESVAKRPKELYLILDDLHHVEAPAAYRLLQSLLDRAPMNLHLVIASRVVPMLSLSRLRVMNQVVEVENASLPFDPPETRRFFDENLGPDALNADELSQIHELTSGWPSCLQLIAIMLKGRPDARSFIDTLVWRSSDLQTYLSEEVMANLSPETAELVETLSLFRRFNGALVEAVTGHPNAHDVLRRMEDENLLICRVDSDDRVAWYRMHRLFAEFLTTRLERRGPQAVQEMHRRASRWFADNACLAEAVRHATLAEDIDFAAVVIERAAPDVWNLEYLSPTLHLLSRLPEEVLFRHPRLLFLASLTVALTSRPSRVHGWLERLQSSDMGASSEIVDSLPVIRAALAIQHDDTQAAIDLLEPVRDTPLPNPFLQYMLVAELTAGYGGAGRYEDARRLLEAHPIPAADRNNDMAQVTEVVHVLTLMLAGEIREAERLGTPLLQRSVRSEGHRSISGNLCAAVIADAYYELDRIDDARETIANRFGLLHASTPEVIMRTNLCRARLDLLQKGPDAALAFLQEQTARLRGLGQERAMAHLLAEQVKVLLIKGARARALEVSAALDEFTARRHKEHGLLAELPAVAALARARLMCLDDAEGALQALDIARGHASAFKRGRLLAQIDLLSASVLEDCNQSADAKACLIRAIEAGHRLGLVRTLVDEGPVVAQLLSRLVRDGGVEGDVMRYAEELLEKLTGCSTGKDASTPARHANAAKSQTVLTKREIEILSLVAQAMSSKRIALALNITLETVKWNLRNIFSKLGVSSRYDAMVWARNQHLIE